MSEKSGSGDRRRETSSYIRWTPESEAALSETVATVKANPLPWRNKGEFWFTVAGALAVKLGQPVSGRAALTRWSIIESRTSEASSGEVAKTSPGSDRGMLAMQREIGILGKKVDALTSKVDAHLEYLKEIWS
jgi:hypothetical protein